MRNFFLVFAASSFLPACLPDPASLFYDSSESEAVEDQEYIYDEGTLDAGDSDGMDTEPFEELNATSSFTFAGQVIAKENVEGGDGDDDKDSGIDFGAQNLSLYCAESAEASAPLGYVRVSIEAFLPNQSDAVMSWQRRLEIPCAGNIDFKYWDLFEGHHYNVKIDHLDLENKVIKTDVGSFSVPEELKAAITFELK